MEMFYTTATTTTKPRRSVEIAARVSSRTRVPNIAASNPAAARYIALGKASNLAFCPAAFADEIGIDHARRETKVATVPIVQVATTARAGNDRASGRRVARAGTEAKAASGDSDGEPPSTRPDLTYGLRITRAIDELEAEGIELDRFARALLIARLTTDACGATRRGAAS